MALHQINVGHLPEQDRLLIRISTTDKLEYRFWLTRHLLRGLWPGLVQRMAQPGPAGEAVAPATQAAMAGFKHERAIGESSFGDDYAQDGLKPALPGDPVLVATVKLASGRGRGHRLEFLPRSGAGITMQFPDRMLHAFAKLLRDASNKAGWDLALKLPTGPVPQSRTVN